ncbi:hypothetical protein SDC9_102100 [bioreactor metagenome]|uniref:Uncharacterized protein n=1 Tax=bioreactor metagenome TaxID=1076179 RepID=A0A645AQX3_9ZZZZ
MTSPLGGMKQLQGYFAGMENYPSSNNRLPRLGYLRYVSSLFKSVCIWAQGNGGYRSSIGTRTTYPQTAIAMVEVIDYCSRSKASLGCFPKKFFKV